MADDDDDDGEEEKQLIDLLCSAAGKKTTFCDENCNVKCNENRSCRAVHVYGPEEPVITDLGIT